MYDLPSFKEKDETVIREFIDNHPFAFLTGCNADNKPVATQVPVFIEEVNGNKILRGHIMRNSNHHKAFVNNPNVLVVFTGPHTYVSATWYSDPNQASTWNYMSVHVEGTIKFLREDALISVLKKTSLHFENNNQQSSTVFDNLPVEYRERLMKAIVAFEIEVTDIQNVFKLSQNRDKKSYDSISEKLKSQGGEAAVVADEMAKRVHQVFHNNKP